VLDRTSALEVLRDGEIEVVGRILGSSNNALFVTVTLPCPDPAEPARVLDAIHKPTIGERPLDDFPDGTLTRREVAAYLVSEASGWDVVPPTVLRDGPFGEGMTQAFIEPDMTVDVIAWINEDDPRLRRMATFDAAVNNTDRKWRAAATCTASTTGCASPRRRSCGPCSGRGEVSRCSPMSWQGSSASARP
jgi:hypothetical protein